MAPRNRPNPLFEKWLTEWRNKAKGTNIETHFEKALSSLKKYPLFLESGRDCILLRYFGTKLCAMLDRKLKEHQENERETLNSKQIVSRDDANIDVLPKKSKSREGPSRPTPELERRKKSRKDKLPLEKSKSADDESLENRAESEATRVRNEFHMAPNNFDVFLLVDVHEVCSGTRSKDDDTRSELSRLSVPYEVRNLKIGDFAWVARCRDTNKELILPYIVERKRTDDLAASIKDGRFHEQKFRLKQSGIPNLIYMVESYRCNQHFGIPLPTLLQASTNSLVQDGFTVKFTNSHSDSLLYLSILTALVQKIYKDKLLRSGTRENLKNARASDNEVALMEFGEFNTAASKVKNFKVKEMLIRHLVQLKGLSVEAALAITEIYPTPVILAKAFETSGASREKLLATTQVGPLKRKLGPAMSKTVCQLYTKRTLE